MKKNILTSIMALMACACAWALTTDGQAYEPVNGIKIANQWIFDRVHSGTSYTTSAICNQRARTATMADGVVYVARSEEKTVVMGTDTISQSVIHRFNAADGTALPDLDLTLNGAPYGTFLGVTSIGKDNFGHIWVAPMTSNVSTKIPVYMVNTQTGELTLITHMDKAEAPQRTDYLDIVGDITLEKAECTMMTVAGSTADPGFPTVYCWRADKGAAPDEWEGGFEGDAYIDFTDFYPETKTGFSLAPVIKIVLGEDEDSRYSGELFYIDCFDGAPVLYSKDGSLIDSFESVEWDLRPQNQPNGCAEFALDGRNFLVYTIADMNGEGHGCQANICELGEGMAFEGMTKYWQVPADSLGKVNDSGLRVHCFATETGIENGEEVVTLLTFKAYNGMAVYKIGKNVQGNDNPGYKQGDVNGDGEVDVNDVNILINIVLGKDDAAKYEGRANVDGAGDVDVTDVNTLINLVLGK